MAYDQGLAERIRGILDERGDVAEKQMFGGVAFLVRGRMCVGIVKEDLMVRVGADAHDELLRRSHVRPMDFTGRPMKGFLFVAPEGVDSDADLQQWVGYGVALATSLPAKAPRATKAKAKARPVPQAGAMRKKSRRP